MVELLLLKRLVEVEVELEVLEVMAQALEVVMEALVFNHPLQELLLIMLVVVVD